MRNARVSGRRGLRPEAGRRRAWGLGAILVLLFVPLFALFVFRRGTAFLSAGHGEGRATPLLGLGSTTSFSVVGLVWPGAGLGLTPVGELEAGVEMGRQACSVS